MKKLICTCLAVILGFTLFLPAPPAYARTVSDLEAYQNYIINMNYELVLNNITYSLYYLKDKKVTQPNDRNSIILFFEKKNGNLVRKKETLEQLTRMYIMGKAKDDYLRMAEIAEWSTPFIVLGTEIWRGFSESLVEGVVGTYIKKKPPVDELMKTAQRLIKDQATNLQNPQFALMLWALVKYYGEIKPDMDYAYGERGIRVEEQYGKTIVSLNNPNVSVYTVYDRFINGYFGYAAFLDALEELDLALEPSFKSVLVETLNALYLGTMSALTGNNAKITKSKIEKEFKEIYKTLKNLNIKLVFDPEKIISIEGPDALEFIRTLDDFVEQLIKYRDAVDERKKRLEYDFDSWAEQASQRRDNIDDYIVNNLDENFVRVKKAETPIHLEGKWYITYLDDNSHTVFWIHSYNPETKEITGFMEGEFANYELVGHLEGDKVKLKAFYATYEDVYKDIANNSGEIPEDKIEIFAKNVFKLGDKIYKTLEFRYENEGRIPILGEGRTWEVSYNVETYEITKFNSDLTMLKKFTVHKEYPEPATVIAKPLLSPVYVDGRPIVFEVYNIEGYNYFKLRDLALALNGTPKNFDVVWDEENKQILLYSKSRYTPIGGELQSSGYTDAVTAKESYPIILLNGSPVFLKAYNINGSNYFKLRDIAQLFDFGVEWDEQFKQLSIRSNDVYIEE